MPDIATATETSPPAAPPDDTQDQPQADPTDALMAGLGVGSGAPASLGLSPSFESNVARVKKFYEPSPLTLAAKRQMAAADFDILKKKQQQAVDEAKQSDELQQKFAGMERSALQHYEHDFANKPPPTFVPSQASAGDFTLLGSLIAIAGFVVGKGKGMQPGLNALSAMTGMMKGWQAGREETYQRERDNFESAWKTFEQQREDFMQKMRDDLELAKTDLQAGLSKIKLHGIEAGSDIIPDLAKKGDLQAIVEALQASDQAGQKAAELVGKIEEKGLARAGISSTPEDVKNLATMIAHYQMPLPMSGLLLRQDPWKSAVVMAEKINPQFHAQNYQKVQQTLRTFTSGAQGNTLRFLTVAAQHLEVFRGMAQALKNNDMRAFNAAAQAWAYQTGGAAPTSFEAVKEVVAREIIKAVSGSGVMTEGELTRLEETMSKANSPEQLLSFADSMTSLIGGQLKGLKRQFESGVKDTGINWEDQGFISPDLEKKYFQSSERFGKKYSVGQIIDAGGKKYRVTGGDLENDPDVELVQ